MHGTSLSSRQYELVVLRVATLTDAAYEWEHHVVTAMEAGLDEEEIDRVRGGGDATGWPHEEAALLRAVDECIADRCIRESTLDALGESFPPEQILDIIATVTMYHAMAIVTRTFEIPIDEKNRASRSRSSTEHYRAVGRSAIVAAARRAAKPRSAVWSPCSVTPSLRSTP